MVLQKQLAESGFLPDDLDSAAVAHFLRTTPSLSKAKIGELFGEPEADCQVTTMHDCKLSYSSYMSCARTRRTWRRFWTPSTSGS